MEMFVVTRTLAPARLARLATAQGACLGAQVDPLRNFVRRQNEGIDVTVRRLEQFQALRRGRDCGPVTDYAV